jgi:hypothetical protein
MAKSRPFTSPKHVAPAAAKYQPIPPEWLEWIATNLLKKVPETSVIEVMQTNGFNMQSCQHAIVHIKQQASFKAAEKQAFDLYKREWLLTSLHKLQSDDPTFHTIPRVHQPTVEWFYTHAWSANRPVIMTGMIDHWPILQRWTAAYLKDNFGHIDIELQYGQNPTGPNGIHLEELRCKKPFAEVINWIEYGQSPEHPFYIAGNNKSFNHAALAELLAEIPPLPPMLETGSLPTFWYGPQGAVTPVHHDGSNNMLIQIRGRKKIKLISACQQSSMYGQDYYYSQVDLDAIDYQRFPLMRDVTIIEEIIHPGEMVFFPVGWYHHVSLLDPCISLACTNYTKPNYFAVDY